MKSTVVLPYAFTVLLVFFGVMDLSAAERGHAVTIESLLNEMVDREAVARFPQADYRLKQESSYNRDSKTAELPGQKPEGWFNNKDFNSNPKDKNFIRIEENEGRKEWVLMDDTGSGAIVRSWMPWSSPTKPETNSIIRFYLDGSSEPVIEGNMFTLFQGKDLIPYPLAHESLRSAVSFFPIPYAKSCKVTVSEQPFFYQFTYREYAEGVAVKTFTPEDFESSKSLTQATCKALLDMASMPPSDAINLKASLATNEQQTLDLPEGQASIRSLSLRLGDYSEESVTRSVVFKIEFDGKETVWCPVGDFFGTGLGLHPFNDRYRTVAEDGTMTCHWVMPYQESAKVSIVNLGDASVEVDLKASVGDWQWDDRSMYFHAAWRGAYPVATRPYSDWNYVTLNGRGVYVGDTLTVMNPVDKWWGEGDEKIFVDGEDFPSIFGTGTEDYYAYSWGGKSNDFYDHPFHAQPRCHLYDKLNRKTDPNDKSTKGYSTETRTRALDAMPFGSSLQLDMEIWSWTDCEMGYGVGMYWYGDAKTTSNRSPDPEETNNVPPSPLN